MPLSNTEINEEVKKGRILVDPFAVENLGGTSYDLSLGEYYFRMQKDQSRPEPRVRNLYSEDAGTMLWGRAQKAHTLKCLAEEYGMFQFADMSNISGEDSIILLEPFEMILGHTHEFVGSTTDFVGEIKDRSSMGRSAIQVCVGANWGDPGYFGRWTLYIRNLSYDRVPLVVGRPIAQIIFEPVTGAVGYREKGGFYQPSCDPETIKANWCPENLLPQLHKSCSVAK